MDLTREAGLSGRVDSKSAPSGERRRAQTATTSGDTRHHSKQMRLISTLRKLMVSSAEISTSITSSDQTLGPADTFSTSKHQANVKTLSVMQNSAKAKTPTQRLHQSSDTNRMYNGDCLSSKGTSEELGTLIISRGNTMLKTSDKTAEPTTSRVGHSLKVKETRPNKDKTTPAKLKTYSQHLQILKGRRMNILRASTEQSQIYPVSIKPGEADVTRTNSRINPASPTRSSTCLSISNSSNYQNILEHSKHRLTKKANSAPQKLTRASRQPHIVIPCHTNVECTLCQLYDEPLESSDTESESELLSETQEDNSKLESKPEPEILSVVHNSMPSRENSTKLPKVLRFDAKEKPVYEKPTPAEVTANEFIEKYRKERLLSKCHRQKKDIKSETDSTLPTIYRLRYTKSSHFTAGPNYSIFEAASAT